MNTVEDTRLVNMILNLAELQRVRNDKYQDQYKNQFGKLMMHLLGPIKIENEDDYNRVKLFMNIVTKLGRYSKNFWDGHPDSLDDLSVYSQMLQEVDEEVLRNGAPF